MVNELVDRDVEEAVNGYKFWRYLEYDGRSWTVFGTARREVGQFSNRVYNIPERV